MSQRYRVLLALLIALVSGCKRSDSATSAAGSASIARSAAVPAPAPSAPAEQPSSQPAPAPAWTRPLLYRVTTQTKPFYVFGTIHLPDQRLDTFPPELERAFAESESVITEIPMDAASQAALAPSLMLPKGKSLTRLLPPPLHARVSAAFQSKGLPFAPFEGMKPWAVGMQVALLDRLLTLALKKPLDAVLEQRASAAGKETGGLESAQEQLRIFDSLTEREQVEFLSQTMDYRDKMLEAKRDPLEELLAAYVAGSEQQLLDAMLESYDPKDPLSAKIMKRLFTDRNRSMTERIVARAKKAPAKTYFFAVGAGHVIGNDGIVARLEKQGLKATRLSN